MTINSSKILDFWKRRAQQDASSVNIGNLEDNKSLQDLKVAEEVAQITKLTSHLNRMSSMLDLGTGTGFWLHHFEGRFKKVTAVDFCDDMLNIARQNTAAKTDIEFICSPAQSFKSDKKFDFVFISGLLIYLSDDDVQELLQNIDSYTTAGSYLALRDGTGVPKQHEIVDQWSESLKANYSALYRTRDRYIEIFNSIGFDLVEDQNMFPEGHPLNKFSETRLRIYLFKKGK